MWQELTAAFGGVSLAEDQNEAKEEEGDGDEDGENVPEIGMEECEILHDYLSRKLDSLDYTEER